VAPLQKCAAVNKTNEANATPRYNGLRRHGYDLVALAIEPPLKLRDKVEAKLDTPTTDDLAMLPLI
jgi:hypothetical protein